MIFMKIQDFMKNTYCPRENTSQPILACDKNDRFLKFKEVCEKAEKVSW